MRQPDVIDLLILIAFAIVIALLDARSLGWLS